MRAGSITVTQSDLERVIAVHVPADKRAQVMASEKKIRDLIAQYYLTLKMAEGAEQRVLNEEEQWRVNYARKRGLAETQVEHLVNLAPAPDFDAIALETYKANPERFTLPEKAHVEHILIDTKTRPDADALQRAERVLAEVRASSRSFSDLAREYSDDPSAKTNGGDLGLFGRGRMVKPFEDAAFNLKDKGDIAGPIKTDFGYHVMRLIERQPATKQSFDEIKTKLIKEETNKFRQKAASELYARLGKPEGAEIDQEAIKAMVKPLDFGNAAKAGHALPK